MVLPAFGGCETNMAARLSRYGVARRDNLFASSLPEMSRGSLTSDDFLSHEVQSDDSRSRTIVEMTPHCVTDLLAEVVHCVCFRADGRTEGLGRVSSLVSIFDNEHELC